MESHAWVDETFPHTIHHLSGTHTTCQEINITPSQENQKRVLQKNGGQCHISKHLVLPQMDHSKQNLYLTPPRLRRKLNTSCHPLRKMRHPLKTPLPRTTTSEE